MNGFDSVPLFPLPNVVLFPQAILPLHIFEERYKAMTADAVEGDRLIAMALLKPGWEKNYYHRPAIEPVVCVGQILSHERLADGKYNFLLRGMVRARVVREVGDRDYRQAELEPVAETPVAEDALAVERRHMQELLGAEPLGTLPGAKQFRQMLGTDMRTTDVADLLAFSFLEDIMLKQSLLAEGDVRGRVRRIVKALEELRPSLAALVSAVSRRSSFPGRPSMN